MIKMEVFGSGCPKCHQTEKNCIEALNLLGLKGEVKPVKEQIEIIKRGITSTPALAINGNVKAMGRIPDTEEIKKWIEEIK